MIELDGQAVRIAINLDLAESVFDLITSHDDLVSGEGSVWTISSAEAVQDAASAMTATGTSSACAPQLHQKSVEVAFFFSRKLDRLGRSVFENQSEIRKACALISKTHRGDAIARIVLVDTGDSFMDPLSDISILAQFMEIASEALDTSAESVVYAVDEDANEDALDYVVRDTRSEAFVGHVANFTRQALKVLNANTGLVEQTTEPREDDGGEFEAIVYDLLTRHEVVDPEAQNEAESNVHWVPWAT